MPNKGKHNSTGLDIYHSVFDGKVGAGDTIRFCGGLNCGAFQQPDNGRGLRVDNKECGPRCSQVLMWMPPSPPLVGVST